VAPRLGNARNAPGIASGAWLDGSVLAFSSL
jgi:hypothetical protein